MKKIFFFFFILFINFSFYSQAQPGWSDIWDWKDRVTFKIPDNYKLVDTLDIRMYAVEKDSITIEMHCVDTKKYIPPIYTVGSMTSAEDTLGVCIDMLLHVTQGTLKSQRTIRHDGRIGKETEILYEEYGQSMIMLNRFYWFNDRLFTFTITATPSRKITLYSYKTVLFNSIRFH